MSKKFLFLVAWNVFDCLHTLIYLSFFYPWCFPKRNLYISLRLIVKENLPVKKDEKSGDKRSADRFDNQMTCRKVSVFFRHPFPKIKSHKIDICCCRFSHLLCLHWACLLAIVWPLTDPTRLQAEGQNLKSLIDFPKPAKLSQPVFLLLVVRIFQL